jgi:hypothetical protein
VGFDILGSLFWYVLMPLVVRLPYVVSSLELPRTDIHCLLPVAIVVRTFSVVGAMTGGNSQASFAPSLFCLPTPAFVHLLVV